MRIEKNKVLVQIGTNDGKDEFNKICIETNPSKIVLVEPNKLLNSDILNNYKDIDNVYIENVAMTEVNKGIVKLVIPKDINKGKSINGRHYSDHHFSLLPMDNWGNDFEILEANSITFSELCKKYNINNIHYLQIDTEGYDVEIIKSIDFKEINIDIIRYELWNFGEDCFKRYGDKAKLYGVNGMKYIFNLLQSLGYMIIEEKNDMIAIKKINNHE